MTIQVVGPRDPSFTEEERAHAKSLADGGNFQLADLIREQDEDFADAMTRETTPTPPPRSDEGYPVDSVIDPDMRALAEFRAMGPARLLKHLRTLHTEWESPTAAPLACDELMETLIAIWGPVGAVKSDLAGLAAREAQPAPVSTNERPIWEMVIEEAEGRWAALGNCDPMRVEILSDMRARHAAGVHKYGRPLTVSTPTPGTPLEEAYAEALDLVAYLRWAVEKGYAAQDLYSRAVNDLVAHKVAMRVAS